MTDPAVVAAVAGATGVIAGSLVSSFGVVLRERVVGRREREAQQALRHQQLADQRAAFQRDTIVALRDGLGELWALSADAYNRAAATRAKTGEWPPPEQADLPTLNTVSARIAALRARVFDDDLRLLVRELQTSLWSAVEASDWSEQEERMVAARDPMNRMQERVHRRPRASPPPSLTGAAVSVTARSGTAPSTRWSSPGRHGRVGSLP